MKITLVGTEYVGLVTGTCFAEVGIEVSCVDGIPIEIIRSYLEKETLLPERRTKDAIFSDVSSTKIL